MLIPVAVSVINHSVFLREMTKALNLTPRSSPSPTPSASSGGDSPLTQATWGLVIATALVFLASLVPATSQIADRRYRKRTRASEVVPILHGARTKIEDISSSLSRLDANSSVEEFAALYYDLEPLTEQIKELENRPGLSVDQRLEVIVLGSHLNLLGLDLSLLGNRHATLRAMVVENMTLEQRITHDVIQANAALLSLDRLEHLFKEIRRRFHGNTFTEEMIARTMKDTDDAERQLAESTSTWTKILLQLSPVSYELVRCLRGAGHLTNNQLVALKAQQPFGGDAVRELELAGILVPMVNISDRKDHQPVYWFPVDGCDDLINASKGLSNGYPAERRWVINALESIGYINRAKQGKSLRQRLRGLRLKVYDRAVRYAASRD
jgi:hypothetical protein